MLYHYAHSSGTSLVSTKKNLPQLIHAIFSKQQLAISGAKPLPKDVDRLVVILHNDDHYIVLEVNIPERKFLIYDGLSRELLQWKDHIIIVLKKCMFLDFSVDSSSTVCVPDAAVPPVFHAAGNLGISSMVIQYFSSAFILRQKIGKVETREGLLHSSDGWIQLWSNPLPQSHGIIWHRHYPLSTGLLQEL